MSQTRTNEVFGTDNRQRLRPPHGKRESRFRSFPLNGIE